VTRRDISVFVRIFVPLKAASRLSFRPCPEGKSMDHINQSRPTTVPSICYSLEQTANRTLNFKVIPRNVSKKMRLYLRYHDGWNEGNLHRYAVAVTDLINLGAIIGKKPKSAQKAVYDSPEEQ
jgi:hypothetical protein